MAINATRASEYCQKKGISIMALRVTKDQAVFNAVGKYLVGILPPEALVTDAFMYTTVVSQPAVVAIGTSEGGAEILSACDTTSVGKSGVFGGLTTTGTGTPVYMQIDAAVTSGEFIVIIEYVEYNKNTGEYTQTV